MLDEQGQRLAHRTLAQAARRVDQRDELAHGGLGRARALRQGEAVGAEVAHGADGGEPGRGVGQVAAQQRRRRHLRPLTIGRNHDLARSRPRFGGVVVDQQGGAIEGAHAPVEDDQRAGRQRGIGGERRLSAPQQHRRSGRLASRPQGHGPRGEAVGVDVRHHHRGLQQEAPHPVPILVAYRVRHAGSPSVIHLIAAVDTFGPWCNNQAARRLDPA